MRALWILGLVMLLGACSSTPRYSYSNTYVAPTKPQYQAPSYQAKTYSALVNSSYSAQRPIQKVSSVSPAVTVSNFERLSYEDLVRFEPDCEQRVEQTALLEEQLKRNRFYTVDGVEGNTYPGKISKSYYSLAKYRIWALRFACQGSEVSRDLIKADLQASPNQPPSAMPRCYFEETVEAKTGYQQTQYLTSDHQSTRKEICTNFPLVQDRPFIRVGEAPEWMSKLPKESGVIYENGTAISSDFSMADLKAKTMAYVKICTGAGGKVRSQMKMYRADNDAASVEQSELTVRSLCPDVDISGVETVEMKHVAEGNRIRTYVLVALPLGSKNVARSAKDIQNRSGEAFKELDGITRDAKEAKEQSTGAVA